MLLYMQKKFHNKNCTFSYIVKMEGQREGVYMIWGYDKVCLGLSQSYDIQFRVGRLKSKGFDTIP